MLSQQYEETVSQYSTTLESIVAEVEPLEELTLVMPVEGTRKRSSKRENKSANITASIGRCSNIS